MEEVGVVEWDGRVKRRTGGGPARQKIPSSLGTQSFVRVSFLPFIFAARVILYISAYIGWGPSHATRIWKELR
jgi:hypothetical protein